MRCCELEETSAYGGNGLDEHLKCETLFEGSSIGIWLLLVMTKVSHRNAPTVTCTACEVFPCYTYLTYTISFHLWYGQSSARHCINIESFRRDAIRYALERAWECT